MNATANIEPGTIIRFKHGGDCRYTETDALGRMWFVSLFNGDRSMEPAGIFKQLVKLGHAVVSPFQEGLAIEQEYASMRERMAGDDD
jgi:hypothetical protein